MTRYHYKGPVIEFDRCIASDWESETLALSRKKAISNLKYQFKKEFNRVTTSKIELPGKLEIV